MKCSLYRGKNSCLNCKVGSPSCMKVKILYDFQSLQVLPEEALPTFYCRVQFIEPSQRKATQKEAANKCFSCIA